MAAQRSEADAILIGVGTGGRDRDQISKVPRTIGAPMNISAVLATAVLTTLLEAAQAQMVVPSGKTRAQGQMPAIAQQCAACHGERGEGLAGVPRIAGQPREYLEKQLQSYANGSRRHPIMEAMAKALSPQEMAGFAVYYAQLDTPVAKVARTAAHTADGAAAQVERGRVLAVKGNAARRVQACANCHGPGGIGEPPAIPYLSGLDAGYLIIAMNAWKNGTRKNDAGQQMATVVQRMTADDITDVAYYFASLPAPKPAPLNIVTSPVRAGDPARGRAIVASGVHGCAACHAIPGIPGPKGIVGPPLTGLAGRSLLAGQLPNNADVLVAFLQHPAALVPRTGMPDVGLDAGEARDIAAFLYTLEPVHAR